MDAGIFLSILFPAACAACQAPLSRGTFCAPCRGSIVPFGTAFCGTCGAALPGFRNLCHPRTPYLLGAAGNYYDERLRELIHALKFGGMRQAAEPLSDILAHYCAGLPIDLRGCVVTPIPISRERMRERGFNQSALIAERFARFFGLPVNGDLLARVAHRTAQSEIHDRDERWDNIRGCYEAHAPPPGRKVLLIDDVTTSGATFAEAALALKAAGARKIFALAVAKAR